MQDFHYNFPIKVLLVLWETWNVNTDSFMYIIIAESLSLNQSYTRNKMSRIQTKDKSTRIYKSNKMPLSCYNDKNFILENEYSDSFHFQKSYR